MEEDYNGAGGWQVTRGEGGTEWREATIFLCMGGGCRRVLFMSLYFHFLINKKRRILFECIIPLLILMFMNHV